MAADPKRTTDKDDPSESVRLQRKKRYEHYIGNLLRKVGLYRAVKRPYFLLNFAYYRGRDMLAGRYQGKPLSASGFYRISPPQNALSPYWCVLNVSESHRRKRISGIYEHGVMEALIEHVGPDTTFWEVGAYQGYFSLALAGIVDSVVAFEAREQALEQLHVAIEKNGFENIQTVNTTLGVDDSLDEYVETLATPDVVLMDIEGWEYQVLQSAIGLLELKPVLVVELHSPDSGWDGSNVSYPEGGGPEDVVTPDEIVPDEVVSLLEKHGYEVTEIHRRRESNWHIVATP